MLPPTVHDADSAAGRVLLVGLPGPDLDRPSAERLARLRPAGVILFARNLVSPARAVALLAALRQALPTPAWFAIDQEGGRVSRLEPWIGPTPRAAALARAGEQATRDFGRATAHALRALGLNFDFAPVVDVCAPDATNGIGDRSFGTDPRRVVDLAAAFLDGLQAEGVAGCLKHFPGLGATRVDSHVELPVAAGDRRRAREVDLVPFRALAAGAAAVMVGHGHHPALDATAGLPASLSEPIVEGLLRGEIGFQGLVVSDDMEMGAVAPLDVGGEAAWRSMRAGCDLLLYCADLERAEAARCRLAAAAREDRAFHDRLLAAAARVESAAARWPVAPEPRAALDEARAQVARLRQALDA